MSVSYKRLIPGSVMTGAPVVYYTAPTGTVSRQAIIQRLIINNTTGGAVAIKVFIVPVGGAAGAASTIINQPALAANGTYVGWEAEGMTLQPGETIQAQGNGASIMASGNEIS